MSLPLDGQPARRGLPHPDTARGTSAQMVLLTPSNRQGIDVDKCRVVLFDSDEALEADVLHDGGNICEACSPHKP